MDAVPSGKLGETKMTRRQLIGEEECKRITPPMGPLAYLLDALTEVGPIVEDTTGCASPVSWSDLMHWPGAKHMLRCEMASIRWLSQQYVRALIVSRDIEQPWSPEVSA